MIITALDATTDADLDGIETDLTIDLGANNVALAADATLDVATGKTLTLTSTAGTDYELDVSAIDGGSTGVFTVDGDISVSSETTLKMTAAQATSEAITGAGAVIITALDATTDADLDGIETDLTIDLGANNVALAADATLDVATGKTLTLTSTAGTDYELDVSAIDGGSTGVFTVDGDISVSSETTLKMTAAQATSEAITGAGAVIITALDATTDADLDGIETDLTIDLGANNVALAADATLDVATGKTLTLTSTAGTDYELDVSAIDGGSTGVFTVDGDISVSSETTLKMTAAQATSEAITGAGAVIITALDATTDADLDGIETDLTIDLGANNVALAADATLDVATGKTLTLTSTAGTDYELDVSAIDGGSTGVFTVDGDISVSSETTLKMTAAQATSEAITGAGAVIITALDATTDADLDGIETDLTIDLGANNVALAADATLDVATGKTLTLTSTAGTDYELDVSAIDGGSTGVFTVDGDISVSSETTLKMTAAQATSEAITGAGAVIITALDATTDADLDGIETDLTIDLGANNVALAADATLDVATGKTLTLTSTAGTDYELDVSAIDGGSTGVFTVDGDISVSSETTLKMTAAQATSEAITGAGAVIITALDATTDADLDGIETDLTIDLGANNVALAADATLDVATGKTLTLTSTAGTDYELDVSAIDGGSTGVFTVDGDISVSSETTLKMTAAQATSEAITGAGAVIITALDATTDADLDGIETDLTIDLGANNVALAADATLDVATGKTLTLTSTAGTDYELDVSAIDGGSTGVFTVDGDISVSSETTLKMTAAQATSEAITGAGAVIITALDATTDADLDGIETDLTIDLGANNVALAADATLDVATGKTLTLTSTAGTDYELDVSAIDGGSTGVFTVDGDISVSSETTLKMTAAQATSEAITGAGAVIITALDATTDADLDGIETDLTIDLGANNVALAADATLDVATGKTLTLTSTAGTDYELDVSAIDGGSTGVFTVDGDISVSSETTLKMTAAQATSEAITGAGAVIITALDATTDADLDGIETDLTIDLGANNVALAADATLDVATGKTLTLTSTAGTDYELDVSAIDGGSTGVFTVDGDISVSSETTLKMTAAQATSEAITGAGAVIITALDATTDADLDGIETDLTIDLEATASTPLTSACCST